MEFHCFVKKGYIDVYRGCYSMGKFFFLIERVS